MIDYIMKCIRAAMRWPGGDSPPMTRLGDGDGAPLGTAGNPLYVVIVDASGDPLGTSGNPVITDEVD